MTEPVRGALRAHLALFLALGGAAWAWCILALGLGTWMRPSLAVGVVAALASLPWWSVLPAWLVGWPGSNLPELWRLAGEGLVPANAGQPSMVTLGGLAVLLVSGALLTRFGLERGRGML